MVSVGARMAPAEGGEGNLEFGSEGSDAVDVVAMRDLLGPVRLHEASLQVAFACQHAWGGEIMVDGYIKIVEGTSGSVSLDVWARLISLSNEIHAVTEHFPLP